MQLKLPIDVLAIIKQLTDHDYQAYIVGGAVRDVLLNPDSEPTDWDFTTDAKPEEILKLFPEAFYENEFGTVAIAREHVAEQFSLDIHNNLPVPKKAGTTQQHNNLKKTIDLGTATKIHESLQGGMGKSKFSQTSQFTIHNSQSKSVFEITTFRSDGIYTDFRRPESVTWGKTIEEDLERRDFTINALGIRIENRESSLPAQTGIENQKARTQNLEPSIQLQPEDYTIIDLHNGIEDLKKKSIRTVGDPSTRFQEDALRMLRAIRFSLQLNFRIEQETLYAVIQHADLIQHISWERIRDEFLKIIASSQPKVGVLLLDKVGLLQYILPELIESKGVDQGGHHTTDVWTHSLDALNACPSSDPIVRLATLIHDIAKPQTARKIPNKNKYSFYNHEVIGARVARDIAKRLKLSNKDVQRIFLLVRHHMFYYQPHNTDASIRRFMRKIGLENINDIIDVRIGDRVGSGARETSWRFEEMKKRMQEQLHQPFAIKDLAINGNDLMKEFDMKPGPQIGNILKELFEKVVEEPELNSKEELMQLVKQSLQI